MNRRLNRKLKVIVFALALLVVFPIVSHAAGKLYRYHSEGGQVVLSSTIPNDRVVFGYEIIDGTTGRLLATVAPQLSTAEVEEKERRERIYKRCMEAQNRVRTLYEIPSDIDYAEEKAIESIDTHITNLRANQVHLRNQLTDMEDQAARTERAGQGLNAVLIRNIERAMRQLGNLDEEIAAKNQEKIDASKRFDEDRSAFGQADCVLVPVR